MLAFLNPVEQQVVEQGGQSQVVVIADRSRSTAPLITGIDATLQNLTSDIAQLPFVTVQNLSSKDSAAQGSTPLQDTLADVARLGQDVTGVILVTDGRITLPEADYPVPLHILKLPAPTADRWVEITSAPSFALVDKNQLMSFIVHDSTAAEVTVTLKLPEQELQQLTVPTNQEISSGFRLSHVGPAAISVSAPALPQEAITENNTAASLVNGVRETFSVLLITGSPHNGTRSLRQVLKGDAGVNLVHFSILRTMFSRDGAAREEMSLIPFPVDKLFGEQLKDFDLVVFDNFITDNLGLYDYYDDILRYVDNGGSVFVLGNDAMADQRGLMQTPLARLMPFSGVPQASDKKFMPRLTDTGERHPVTQVLSADATHWGKLGQLVQVQNPEGDVLMADDAMHPLLILNEVNKGRVAALLTSQIWLWGREAPGGPQIELLKRIAHWLMRAPSLEANQLQMTTTDKGLTLAYKGVDKVELLQVTLTRPDGQTQSVTLSTDNQFTAQFEASAQGLYTAQAGEMRAYAVVGSSQDHEWRTAPDQDKKLAAYAQKSGGRLFEITPEQLPDIIEVKSTARKAGRGWIGLAPGPKNVTILGQTPLFEDWMWLILLLSLLVATWAHESRLYRKVYFAAPLVSYLSRRANKVGPRS
jgi:hypothetical protein